MYGIRSGFRLEYQVDTERNLKGGSNRHRKWIPNVIVSASQMKSEVVFERNPQWILDEIQNGYKIESKVHSKLNPKGSQNPF